MPLNSHDKGGEWVDFVFFVCVFFSVTLLMLWLKGEKPG